MSSSSPPSRDGSARKARFTSPLASLLAHLVLLNLLPQRLLDLREPVLADLIAAIAFSTFGTN